MLDFDTALDLLNKYGYTSIQVHPFVYQDGDTIGICYTYIDEEYGLLERIKIFNNAEEYEDFLKMYSWVQTNGKLHHVRMILDNYEAINPKIMFLRNEKIMVEGEMFEIEDYDAREALRVNMDPVSKVIYEAGDLLLVYNEIKNRQLQYLKNIVKLRNGLRRKYYDLQLEVDKYNKVKVERVLNLLPEVTESGINEVMESSIKDRYNIYVAQRPEYEEALAFLKEVWDLCLQLELNTKYYQALKEETDIRNETKVVEEKLTYMRELNSNLKPLFGTDLVGRFRKINRDCKATSTEISVEYINQQMENVNRKYSYFNSIDTLYTSDYLREATQNSNYGDLAIKYATGTNFDVISKYKTPLNEVAASLSVQYRDKLSVDEQSILIIYNNPKYRIFCDVILNLENFETLPVKDIVKALNKVKGFSKLKSECYDSVKRRIDDPVNQKIKNSIFAGYDFTTFDTFITSLVNNLAKLKSVNEKMVLNGDINMYQHVEKVEEVESKLFVTTTNDLQTLIVHARDNKGMVAITLLKEGTPVLYSPYCFDLGDIYGKGASPEMFIKEMINFELLVDISDITINIDPNKTYVARYYSEPNVVGNLSIVDHIKMDYKTKFCKYAFTSKISTVVQMNQATSVATNVTPVVNSVLDANALLAVSKDNEQTTVSVTSTVENVVNVQNNEASVKEEVKISGNPSTSQEEKVKVEDKKEETTKVGVVPVAKNATPTTQVSKVAPATSSTTTKPVSPASSSKPAVASSSSGTAQVTKSVTQGTKTVTTVKPVTQNTSGTKTVAPAANSQPVVKTTQPAVTANQAKPAVQNQTTNLENKS